jgi:hypothetical protein
VDTSDQHLVHLLGYCCTELPKAYNYEWDLWLDASSRSSSPPPGGVTCYYQHLFCRTHFISPWTQGGPSSMSPTPVVATAGPAASTPRGPAINVSNSGGGRCLKSQQQPPGSPPSMSSPSVVAAIGPADSTPQGARHRRFAKHGTCR